MRAIEVSEYGDSEVLQVVDREAPRAGEGDLEIAVGAAGVNFADIEQRRGNYPGGPRPPFVPGLEVAGTVLEAPDDAEFDAGDRVAALTSSGGYAERAIAPVETTIPVPDSLSLREAAAIPVQGLTAHNTLFEWGGLEAGERVLVHAAAGGVGSLAVQLAALTGAEVFATASTEDKRDLARELGADHAIDYTDVDVAEVIDECTDGEGVDLVLDGVGGDAFAASLEALAPAGRIVSFGMASGSIPTVATPRLFFSNQSVIGYHLTNALETVPERVHAAVPDLLAALESCEIVVGETVDLGEAGRAHEALESRETIGKVVLEP